jgi:RNA polymerase sigma-70 factor (ECF subfamily)
VPDDSGFRDLLQRVRGGDEEAAAELVRTYEPAIRAAVRVRLTDPRLRRLCDSMDICQSVMANFFVRAASGDFELDRADQLLKLLATMARNRLVNEALKHRAARRDGRRVEQGEWDDQRIAGRDQTPSQVVGHRELLHAARTRLTDDERRIADQRALGRGWKEIAAETGETPDALRVRFARAMDRVVQELGLEG